MFVRCIGAFRKQIGLNSIKNKIFLICYSKIGEKQKNLIYTRKTLVNKMCPQQACCNKLECQQLVTMLLFYQVATRLSHTTCNKSVELKLLTRHWQLINKLGTSSANTSCWQLSCWNSIATSLLQVRCNLIVRFYVYTLTQKNLKHWYINNLFCNVIPQFHQVHWTRLQHLVQVDDFHGWLCDRIADLPHRAGMQLKYKYNNFIQNWQMYPV